MIVLVVKMNWDACSRSMNAGAQKSDSSAKIPMIVPDCTPSHGTSLKCRFGMFDKKYCKFRSTMYSVTCFKLLKAAFVAVIIDKTPSAGFFADINC